MPGECLAATEGSSLSALDRLRDRFLEFLNAWSNAAAMGSPAIPALSIIPLAARERKDRRE